MVELNIVLGVQNSFRDAFDPYHLLDLVSRQDPQGADPGVSIDQGHVRR